MRKNELPELRRSEGSLFDPIYKLGWFAFGAFVGATYTYYFDESQGRRRRALLRDKGVRLGHDASMYGGKLARDLANRGKGLIVDKVSPSKFKQVDDETLRNRVRSEFGHVITHAGAVDVQVQKGEVTLSGPILTSEVEDLIHCVRNVPGVKHVVNQLEVYQRPDDIPSLQGEGRPRREIPYLQ